MSKSRILSLLGGLLLGGAAAHGVTLKERFDQTVPLRSGEVRLANVNGGIVFEAWDRGEVRIEAEKQVRAGNDETAHKLMSQIRIEVTPGRSGLRIDTHIPKSESGLFDGLFGDSVSVGVSYKIHVPRQASIEVVDSNGGIRLTGTRGNAHLHTTNGGLAVEDVQGDMDLETTNGSIGVDRSSGALKAVTTNGGIKAELADLSAGADLSLETTNGGVSLRLPRDARFSVDAETSNGGVASDFPVQGGQPGRRSLKGDVNGGGSKVVIRTTNGGVHIRPL
ncbi:MAG TPA: DUF4097 family beta strand repeat-containing protein [Thermoanaerobaculia bacterium]|jgi:DUF4097 and DUF4098 domain-containing protein YvlB